MKKKGFTLIELLVAVVIIGLIIFFLIPILQKRESISPEAQCRYVLSALNRAMRSYANDYEGLYPTANQWCDLLVENTNQQRKLKRKNLQGR